MSTCCFSSTHHIPVFADGLMVIGSKDKVRFVLQLQ